MPQCQPGSHPESEKKRLFAYECEEETTEIIGIEKRKKQLK
jgi:hypothetical protein